MTLTSPAAGTDLSDPEVSARLELSAGWTVSRRSALARVETPLLEEGAPPDVDAPEVEGVVAEVGGLAGDGAGSEVSLTSLSSPSA